MTTTEFRHELLVPDKAIEHGTRPLTDEIGGGNPDRRTRWTFFIITVVLVASAAGTAAALGVSVVVTAVAMAAYVLFVRMVLLWLSYTTR